MNDAQRTALPRADAQFLVGRLHLLCEPTRLRTIDVLHRVRELCVGDLEARRDGRVVFYALSERFPRKLLTDCVVRLGELSRGVPAPGAEAEGSLP